MDELSKKQTEKSGKGKRTPSRQYIAVVGMACRFPDADDYNQFWDNLTRGRVSISEIPNIPSRWNVDEYWSNNIEETNKTMSKWGGLIKDIDLFDNRFFNISPREAKNMDPQQRLLIEETYHCIEDAAVPLYELQTRQTSVFIGVMARDYHQEASSSDDVIIDSYAGLGNYDCILANRLSFFFDLKGESMAVDAACASSLVAIHHAKHSLETMESDYALAGGVNLTCHPWKYISFSKSRMLSPDGRCKTFDRDANGYVPGEGIAVILMQRLEDALKAGNHIYGIIRGTAVNHGGRTKSITAPKVQAQKRVILDAYKNSGLSPYDTTYVEAHGTGTSLGDPIEIESLSKAFRDYIPQRIEASVFEEQIRAKLEDAPADLQLITNLYKLDRRERVYNFQAEDPEMILPYVRRILTRIGYLRPLDKQFCLVGSAKSNIGHLEAAAGIAGVIKLLLMLREKHVPRTCSLENINPIINFDDSPFKPCLKLTPWQPRIPDLPLQASVSSFGFGGVNSHTVVQEFIEQRQRSKGVKAEDEYMFILSALTPDSLKRLVARWKAFVRTETFRNEDLFNICYTLQVSRKNLPYRFGAIVRKHKTAGKEEENTKNGELARIVEQISDFQPVKADKPFCLRIGSVDWSNQENITEFIKFRSSFGFHLNSLKKYFSTARAEELFDIQVENEHMEERGPTFSFLKSYAFCHSLMDYGFTPNMTSGEGSGVLLSLVLARMLSIEDAIGLLEGTKQWNAVTFERPALPFSDAVTNRTIMPFHFTGTIVREMLKHLTHDSIPLGQILIDYNLKRSQPRAGKDADTARESAILSWTQTITKEQLTEAVALKTAGDPRKLGAILVDKGYCTEEQVNEAIHTQDIIRHFVNKMLNPFVDTARELNTSQFTFKKFLEEWDSTLRQYDRTISDLLHNEALLHEQDGVMRREKLLLMVIIVSCLRKLNQKWDLSELLRIEQQEFFYVLIDFIVDGMLPRDVLVDLLLKEKPDYEATAAILNKRQHYGGGRESYELIRLRYNRIDEVEAFRNPGEWYRKATALIDTRPRGKIGAYSLEAVQFVEMGSFHHFMQQESPLLLTTSCGSGHAGRAEGRGDFANTFMENLLNLWRHGVDVEWYKLYPKSESTRVRLPWQQGMDVEWSKLHPRSDYSRVVLPTYPFEGSSFWLIRKEGRSKGETSLSGGKLTPLDTHGVRYARTFSLNETIVRDHVINGAHVLPGASLIEAGLEAVKRAKHRRIQVLQNVMINNPGIVKAHLEINVEIDRRQKRFVLRTAQENLCEGRYTEEEIRTPGAPDISHIIRDFRKEQEISRLYPDFHDRGYAYGEKLRIVGTLWKEGPVYIFEIIDLDGSEGLASQLSPFLLDGAFQAILAAYFRIQKEQAGDTMYLPYYIKELVLYGNLIKNCLVCVNEADLIRKGQDFSATFTIRTDTGKLLGTVSEMMFKRVHRKALFAGKTEGISNIFFFQPAWQEQPLVRSTVDTSRKIALILAADENLSSELNRIIASRYQQVYLLVQSDKYEKEAQDRFAVNPEQEYDYMTVIQEIFTELGGHYNGCDIYHTWAWNYAAAPRSLTELTAQLLAGLRSLYHLLKVMAARKINGSLDCIFAATDAHIADAGDRGQGFLQASLDGFLKSLAIEILRLRIKCIDFAPDATPPRVARLLFDEMRASGDPEIAAYRSGKRFVQTPVPVMTAAAESRSLFRENGVYVIAGGAGGIGLKIAADLMATSRARLVLLGRSAFTEELAARLAALKGGDRLQYLQADITDPEQVQAAVRIIKERWGALRGVIHSVGVLSDKLLKEKPWEDSWEVLKPKVLGAWNLHNITQTEPLDFFTVFSSVVSINGQAGQADYAAANSFLDAFMHWRRTNSFPGRSLSINWTLWADGGMGVNPTIRAAFENKSGVIYSNQAVQAFYQALAAAPTQLIITGRALTTTSLSQEQPVRAAKPDLEAVLKKLLAAIIHVDQHDLDTAVDLREYGLDSVGFTEFADKINAELKTAVNPTLIFEYPAIRSLALYLAEQYFSSADEAQPGGNAARPAAAASGQPVGETLAGLLAKVIQVPAEALDANTDLREYGLDSVGFTEYAEAINRALPTAVNPTLFFEYPTLAALTRHLTDQLQPAGTPARAQTPPPERKQVRQGAGSLRQTVIRELIRILAGVIQASQEELDESVDIREYGLDSVGFTEFSEKINASLNTAVNPTLFFEYPNLQALASHLMNNYNLANQDETLAPQAELETARLPFNLEVQEPQSSGIYRVAAAAPLPEPAFQPTPRSPARGEVDVAIVGIAGRFPGADNLQTFWQNLLEGKDSITLVPEDRWNWEEFFGDPQGEKNKTNSKWGGFLSDIRRFDAKFFKISPLEAECMDPQQRLLMEETWHAIEDAGYRPSSLAGSKTGVFIGVCNDDYNELLVKNDVRMDAYTSTGSYFSILANRLSFLLNIHGPSLAMDTACSSALVAIRQAIQSIHNGDSDLAIAGGVNICCTPRRYISFGHAGMLSPDGRCKTFDKRANGYVRGEGVGIIFMKPLKNAIEDGNTIYGIVKGTAVNHGGFSTSLTAPNPNAQAELLVEAYTRAGVDPATVTYIETHGTGTSLGDPIEINGVKKAFKELYANWGLDAAEKPHCGLGSVKTNIGHLESAAGIAGVLKLILGMKYGMLPRLLHFTGINPYIDLEGTPFYVLQENREWKRLQDRTGRSIPRRAGVSSFGFGGANAHVVIEEYIPPAKPTAANAGEPALIVLSAHTDERLKAYARSLVEFLDTEPDYDLHEVAYTLQNGREALEERVAVLTGDRQTLKKSLTAFYQGKMKIHGLWRNADNGNQADMDLLIQGRAGRQFLKTVIEDKELDKLAQLWVGGVDLDWNLVYPGTKPARIPLPGYPFGGEKYWIGKDINELLPVNYKSAGLHLHRLIASNVSTLRELRFNTIFSGNEFFLADHIVQGQKVLPGVAYIEMARAAGKLVCEKEILALKDIIWLNPIIIGNLAKEVNINFADENERITFEISSQDSGRERVLHCQGKLLLNHTQPVPTPLNLSEIRSRLIETRNKDECYKLFACTGLAYGPSFQCITELHYNANEALAEIKLPAKASQELKEFFLHPALLDSALQTILGIIGEEAAATETTYLPFSMDRVDLYQPLPALCYAVATTDNRSKNQDRLKFNIKITDTEGVVLAQIHNFTMRARKGAESSEGAVARPRQGRIRLTDEQVLELLRRLQAGQLDSAQADLLIGGYYGR